MQTLETFKAKINSNYSQGKLAKIEGHFILGEVYCKYFLFDVNKPLIFTYSNAGNCTPKNKINDISYSPWGFNFVKKNNYNVISFSPIGGPNWFRDSLFNSKLTHLAEILDIFKIKLGYGGSMGGYAAGAHANLFNFERVLLLNPISTINQELAPWENRFKYAREFNWSSDYHDGADFICPGYIVYDPLLKADSQHAKRYDDINHLRLYGVGHNMPDHLLELNMLKKLFHDFLNDSIDTAWFYKSARARKNYSKHYHWLAGNENSFRTPKRLNVIRMHQHSIIGYRQGENDQEYIDMLMESAKLLESIDIPLTIKLLKKIKEFRPAHPYVKKKLKEISSQNT